MYELHSPQPATLAGIPGLIPARLTHRRAVSPSLVPRTVPHARVLAARLSARLRPRGKPSHNSRCSEPQSGVGAALSPAVPGAERPARRQLTRPHRHHSAKQLTPILLSRRSAAEILIKADATKSSGDKTWTVTGNMASLPTRSMAARPFRHPIQKIYCSIRAPAWPPAGTDGVRRVFCRHASHGSRLLPPTGAAAAAPQVARHAVTPAAVAV